MIKIGDLFDIEKGTVQSSKCIKGNYNFITASEEWKTHNKYTHECEALIFAMGASGSLGRTHYVNGKFVASDLCFILIPKPKYRNKLNLRFYYYYFNTFREKIVSATATGTSKLAINRKIFSNYEIHFIDIDRQTALIGKIEKIQEVSQNISIEIQKQEKYITSLRQSILQQAVEGKLCEQDSNDEPASILLEKIKAEKEKLISEKKIKKQKKLPSITEEEKPFELPQGWEWCRIGDICEINPRNNELDEKECSFIPMNLISDGYNNSHKYEIKKWKAIKSGFTHFKNGDIGIAKITPCFENRKSVIFQNLYNGFGAGTTELHILRTNQTFTARYILNMVKSYNFIQSGVKTYTGTAGQQRIGKNFIEMYILPLPPLAEQQRIVERVDKLMALCDELEKEVLSAKKYASQLMESVLQEAFNSKDETSKKNIDINL